MNVLIRIIYGLLVFILFPLWMPILIIGFFAWSLYDIGKDVDNYIRKKIYE